MYKAHDKLLPNSYQNLTLVTKNLTSEVKISKIQKKVILGVLKLSRFICPQPNYLLLFQFKQPQTYQTLYIFDVCSAVILLQKHSDTINVPFIVKIFNTLIIYDILGRY
jgi:hypothetical protein